tara:strand:+ start:207 stop:413 length:207 start_codon:yes stop_codon:yes gene_type:complete
MKLEESDDNLINFTGFGVYGLGYDSWFQSKIYFKINKENGSFELTPDNSKHKNYPQTGKCLDKNSGKN